MTSVFAVEWCSCIYESGYDVVTLHTTKRSALRAMIVTANTKWQRGRDDNLTYGKYGHDPLMYQSWRVRELPVLT